MASLKEVKGRIATVQNTQKITSAMKMVASAKLHKAQGAIGNMLPYEEQLHQLLANLLAGNEKIESIYTISREVKKVAIVAFSSNSSLCGGFNSNVIRHLTDLINQYASLGKENIQIYPIGKKVADAVIKMGYKAEGNYENIAGKPSFKETAEIAEELMQKFVDKQIDEVVLLYHHFKSTASQIITQENFLPIDITKHAACENESFGTDYILEPSREELMEALLPKALRLKLFTVLLDSNASEHAARTMAMQIATDNANDLLQELTIMYNKTRQQAITNELLDVVGGQMA